jgi:SAM-dependent methyltransferase
MKINQYLDFLSSPKDHSDLKLYSNKLIDESGNIFPIIKEIPRFVEEVNYADSFGYQWNLFDKVQLDGFTNRNISSDRFFSYTGWNLEQLKNKNLLEVGSGAGRFSEVLLKTGLNLFSIDYSNAVEANWKNNKEIGNFFLAQANIYNMPFKDSIFDFIFCFGVIQHTPDPKASFVSMLKHLKVGGQIAMDVYPKNWKSFFYSKYWVRWVTKRMNKETLLKLIKWYIPKWFPISTLLFKIPLIGKTIGSIIPIANYSHLFPELSKTELVEWAILDTFDMLSPAYDIPQSLKTVRKWATSANLQILYCGKGSNGYVLVAKKL